MAWVYYILLLIVLVAGLLLNVLTLPGLWVMVAAYGLYGWVTGWEHFVGWPSLVVVFALASAAEVVELLAGSAGAKAAGASKRAMFAAVVGAMLGGIFLTVLIPLPIVGTIVGVCLGAALGAGIVEMMIVPDIWRSVRVGTGAFKGRFLGLVSKLAIGAIMLLVMAFTGLPIGGRGGATQPATTAPRTPAGTTPGATSPATPASAPATTTSSLQ